MADNRDAGAHTIATAQQRIAALRASLDRQDGNRHYVLQGKERLLTMRALDTLEREVLPELLERQARTEADALT